MSKRYPGGFITKTAPQPTGGDTGTAPGVWTLEQAMEYQKAGTWPSPPPPNYIEDVFSTYIYTGNDGTQTITNGINLSGKGGLVWIKWRSGVYGSVDHNLYDTSRGVLNRLYSNLPDAQTNQPSSLTAFNSNGFTLGGTAGTNGSSANYVSWTFREQAKFFDVVTYTGNGAAGRTVAHNLGSVPGCIFVKSIATGEDWYVYHRSTGATNFLKLNTTGSAVAFTNIWNDTSPTSTVFTVGSDSGVNNSGISYIAYLFAHDAGGFGLTGTDNVISCGSFTTSPSGSATVTLGWEPQFVLAKTSSEAASWYMYDNMRGMPVGSGDQQLAANESSAEVLTGDRISPSPTGFSSTWANGSATVIYIAIRRGPMKTPTSATTVFQPVSFTGDNSANTTRGTITTDLTIISATNAGSPQGSYNQSFFDRLRGEDRSLTSSSAATEVNGWRDTYFNLDQQVGWSNGSDTTYLNNSTITYASYIFRRAPGFFDEVCYTGTSDSNTVFNHNLGVTPELMLVKNRSASASWVAINCSTKTYGNLNNTTAFIGPASGFNFTSTTFAYGANYGNSNNNSPYTYVAYLFATVAGVSKVGTYTGTGTTLQVNCGFTGGSRWVMIKRTDDVGDWYVWDSARGIIAGNDPYLLLNSTAAEVTGTDYVDTYSAGFEISSTAPAGINANGGTYIFLAIA